MSFSFITESILLGFGLAMDAFAVSTANGLHEPEMKASKMHTIAGMFGLFQYLMPVLGWICVHFLVEAFTSFQKFIPWIALLLLLYIGGKMLIEGLRGGEQESGTAVLGIRTLLVQAVATSIDALSVGFTTASFDWPAANISSLIIGAVTYLISVAGVLIGRKFGTKLSGRAAVLGGLILIGIGIRIFAEGVLL